MHWQTAISLPVHQVKFISPQSKFATLGTQNDNETHFSLHNHSARAFFTIRVIATEPGGIDDTDVDIADLNSDGIQDLVAAYPTNGSRTAILLGNGDGNFGADSIILEPDLRVPQHQALADYDGDGNIDLALSLGDGDGTFQPLTYYLKPVPLSRLGGAAIVSRDFNSDSKPDIALAVGVASIALNVLINSTGTPPPPAPVTVSSVTLSPSTVTLSASVQTEKTVQLSSSLAAATFPASVTVAAGASTANFTVNTSQVSATTTAPITATLNGTSRSANLTINPPGSTVDTVSITRAEYESSKRTFVSKQLARGRTRHCKSLSRQVVS
jgi:hypothetical protein